MQLGAFIPQGKENLLSVTDTSTASPIQLASFSNEQPTQVLVYNEGPNDCFFAWSSAASVAAALPAAGTPQPGQTVPAGAVMVITTAPNVYYAAICATGKTAGLHLTPGQGN